MTPTNAELVARARALDAAATARPWRVGRKVRRTLYWQIGQAPSDGDALIGLMDWKGDAAFIAAARDLLPLLADRLEAAEGAGGVEAQHVEGEEQSNGHED